MKVALLGDIGFFGKFCVTNNPELKEYFKEISDFLGEHDVVIGNLETPFVEKLTPYGAKSAHIYADPLNIELLKYLNISHVNLSNNHIYDFGEHSYELTKSILTNNDVEFFGVESKQNYVEKDGVKVALQGYCSYNTNPLKVTFDQSKGVNGLDIDLMVENFKCNSNNGYFNIVSMHSGLEHVNYPSQDDIKMARKLGDLAPYLYYGHHPHVAQGVEEYSESLLAYSLGNFCFSDVYTEKSTLPLIKMSENNKTGLILSLEISPTGIENYEAIPIYMSEKSMELGTKSVNIDLDEYTKSIKLDVNIYESKRQKLVDEYIGSRIKQRDIKFYLKRLNINSIKLILASKLNALKYKRHVKSKL